MSMGFSKYVVMWVKSYISGRNQRVVTKSDGESDWLTTNLGVLQGSDLEPPFFNLYINDIMELFSSFHDMDETSTDGVAHLLYADDLQIYTQVTRDNLCEGISRLSAVARAVSTWASDNALHLNAAAMQKRLFLALTIISTEYRD